MHFRTPGQGLPDLVCDFQEIVQVRFCKRIKRNNVSVDVLGYRLGRTTSELRLDEDRCRALLSGAIE